MLEHRPVRRRARTLAAALASAVTVGALLPVAAGAATTSPPRRIVSGWGYFTSTSSSSMTSLAANADLFTDVSPFWYAAQWTGSSSTIAAPYAYNKSSVLPAIRATGVKVLPTITDGMPARRMAWVLAGSSSRATFVNQIVSLVTSNGFDGIDLDFENFAFVDGSSTWSTTRPAWDAFLTQLSAGLHAQGRMLSVTVPAGTATSSDSTGYWVYDWSTVGRVADRVRIMAYDYSPSWPGPIAPFSWVDRVAAHAVTQIPSGKVQIGVPAYGRDWYVSTAGTCPTLPPAGSTSSQSDTFFSDLAWAGQRHTFSSSGAVGPNGYVSTLFTADEAFLPSGAITTFPSPVSSYFDPSGGEQTFPYTVTFNGQTQPATVSATAVGGLKGQSTVQVASVAGVTTEMVVSGSSAIPAGTTVKQLSGNLLTLSAANSGDVTGPLTLTGTTVVAATGDAATAPTTIGVPSGTAVSVGDAVSGTGIAGGTTVSAISSDGATITLSQPLAAAFVSGEQVTFTHVVTTTAVGGLATGSTVLLSSTQGVTKGGAATGPGIASGATVTGVSGNTVTLSAANTGAVTGTVRVTPAPVTQSCTVSRVGWYSDARAVAQTATLVGKYQLLGIAEWTIGGEDPGQWAPLRSYALTIAPTPTQVSIAAPSVAPYGSRPTVRVTAMSAGLPVAGAAVTLYFRPVGGRSWTVVGQATSSSSGTASFTPVVTAAGNFHVHVSGTYDRALGAGDHVVRLGTSIGLSAPWTPVRAGTRVGVLVRLAPAVRGQVVVLQVLRSRRAYTLGIRRTDAAGRAFFVVVPTPARTRTTYRVIADGSRLAAGAQRLFPITTR